jgi:hypothetical protein
MMGEPKMPLKRKGPFVAGQSFDAMKSIAEILGAAKSSIVIVDGYVDDSTLNLCQQAARRHGGGADL